MTNEGEFVALLRRMARSHLGTASAAFDQAADEIERLRQRLFDCETSLNVWDDTRDSEYWLRYGEPSTLEPAK